MTVALARPEATLDSRYTASEGWVYMTGTQALVRLPIQQRLRDAAAGLNTGGYISGYRGSPLGRYDIELWRATGRSLSSHNIVFRPGLNEDLAATAIWGAQHISTAFPARPSMACSASGTARGRALTARATRCATRISPALRPRAARSRSPATITARNLRPRSISPTLLFIAVGMPVIYPSNTQELLDFGLHGIAMSRFSGCWVGMKVVTDVAEGGGTVYVGPDFAPKSSFPNGRAIRPGAFGARTIDAPVAQEERLYNHKLPAALAYARANGLNRIIGDGEEARIGVVAAGKAWQDLLQALGNLGLADNGAGARRPPAQGRHGVAARFRDRARLCPGPRSHRCGRGEAPLLEDQIRSDSLWRFASAAHRRQIFRRSGVRPFAGRAAIPNFGEITPELIAAVLIKAVSRHDPNCALSAPEAPGADAQQSPGADAQPGLLRRMPAQPFDPRARRQPGARRALAAIGWRRWSIRNRPRPLRIWAAKERHVARPTAVHQARITCSPTSAMAPTRIRVRSRFVRRSRPTCRSPTRSSSTASSR